MNPTGIEQPSLNPTAQKICIVEDNRDLADIYKTRLEMLGYNCFVANDGIAALYLIQKEQPHLVLLDLMVPNVAGDEILRRMRANDWGKNIPVFIISNLNEADAPEGLRELNIVGYVVKANLADDGLDKIVNSILKPADKPSLATEPVPASLAGLQPPADVPVQEPSAVSSAPLPPAPAAPMPQPVVPPIPVQEPPIVPPAAEPPQQPLPPPAPSL